MTSRLRARCWAAAILFAIASLGGGFGIAPLGGAQSAAAQGADAKGGKPVVTLTTSLGVIELELDAEKAPLSVANFLTYVDAGHYDGTIFHRVIPNFMIQGGGFTPDFAQKPTRAPIKNEAANGLNNTRGTIAMARTNVVGQRHRAVLHQPEGQRLPQPPRPAARPSATPCSASVTKGMDVVDKIAAVPTGSKGGHQDVPKADVLITSAKRKK